MSDLRHVCPDCLGTGKDAVHDGPECRRCLGNGYLVESGVVVREVDVGELPKISDGAGVLTEEQSDKFIKFAFKSYDEAPKCPGGGRKFSKTRPPRDDEDSDLMYGCGSCDHYFMKSELDGEAVPVHLAITKLKTDLRLRKI